MIATITETVLTTGIQTGARLTTVIVTIMATGIITGIQVITEGILIRLLLIIHGETGLLQVIPGPGLITLRGINLRMLTGSHLCLTGIIL